MGHLADRIRRYAAHHEMWERGARIVAAVSGGSDSVALAFVLRDLAARDEIVLAGIAHLNHQIRGAAAHEDAAFCRALADRLGVAALMSESDVPAAAREHGVSLEVAGRHARQRFFKEALASVRADRVAVAHTRDDQAETVLLRLTRGAGGGGLGAMTPRRDQLVRPLLDTTRHDLQNYLGALDEPWREDETNLDRAIPRNRIRHDVMPHLRAINAQADAALARTAEILRGDEEFLEALANAAFMRCVETDTTHGKVEVVAAEMARLPVAVARRVARYALETANPSRSYGLEDADELRRALATGTGGNLPQLTMERFGAKVVLSITGIHEVHPSVDSFQLRLELPGTVEAPHGDWTMTAEGPMPMAAYPRTGWPASETLRAPKVVVDARELGSHLIVRYRRPGDRLQPLGAPGRRKVQDVLVDRKVPRDDRDRLPIVTTETGEIVWVAGQVLADPFRVTPLTTSVVVLTLRR